MCKMHPEAFVLIDSKNLYFGENNTDGPFQTPYFFTTFFFPPVSLTADSREIYDRHSPGELPFSSGNLLLVK